MIALLKVFNHLYRSVVKPPFTCGRFLDSLQPQQPRWHCPETGLKNKRSPIKSGECKPGWRKEGLVVKEKKKKKVLRAHDLGMKWMKITACLQEETGGWRVDKRDSGRKEREEKCALCDSKWFCPKWNIQIINITSAISHLRSRFTVISQQLDAVTWTKSFYIMVPVRLTGYSCLLILHMLYICSIFESIRIEWYFPTSNIFRQ